MSAKKFKDGVKEHCLPLGLITAVACGAIFPQPAAAVSRLGWVQVLCMVVIFVISGLKLKVLEVKEAAKEWRSWSYGILSILLITPMIGGWMTRLLLKVSPAELQVGLVLFFIMPCSISSGVLISKAAGGSFALALMMTVVTNVVGVFTVPIFAKWMLPFGDASLHLDVIGLLTKLILTVLLPLVVGKAVAFIPQVHSLVNKFNVPLTMVSNFFLVLVPWMKVGVSMEAGVFKSVSIGAFLTAAGWGIMMHVIFLIVNGLVSLYILRVPLASVKSITITASQKTLPIALAVAAFLPKEAGDMGLIALPCIVSHLSQIICDSALASWWKKATTKAPASPATASSYKEFHDDPPANNATDGGRKEENVASLELTPVGDDLDAEEAQIDE